MVIISFTIQLLGLNLPTQKQQKRKTFLLKFISSRDGPVKGMENGRDENMQEDYRTTEHWWKRKQEDYPHVYN